MIPIDQEERIEWIKNRKAKFESYMFKDQINNQLVKDGEEAYVQGLNFAAILCINVALNHLLFHITKAKPDDKGKVPSTSEMIITARKIEIFSPELKKDLLDFQSIVRNQIEHKKTYSSMYIGLFRFLEAKDPDFYKQYEDNPVIYDLILPYIAYKAIEYYYCVCDAWFDFLVKKNERREN